MMRVPLSPSFPRVSSVAQPRSFAPRRATQFPTALRRACVKTKAFLRGYARRPSVGGEPQSHVLLILGVMAVRCRRAAFDHYPIQERRQDSLYGDQGTRQRSDLRMPVGGLLVRFARWLIIHPLAASSSPRRFRRIGEAPKTVKLFVNTVAMGFDSASSTPAAQV
jgi:hypothetical protein